MYSPWITFDEESCRSTTMADIKKWNSHKGWHFFEPGTMRFFNSRVSGDVYPRKDGKAIYFVTSERFSERTPRQYSVRICLKDYSISTVGEFGQYGSLREAKAAAKLLAEGGAE